MPLKMIGYWRWLGSRHPQAPDDSMLPDPHHLIDHSWDPVVKRQIVLYLKRGKPVVYYKGFSSCRFDCGIDPEDMGTAELADGVWTWPEGLAHYVWVHSVRLPSAFVEHARRQQFEIPEQLSGKVTGRPDYDLSFWVEWARQQSCTGSPGQIDHRDRIEGSASHD